MSEKGVPSLLQAIPIVDPATGNPTSYFVQWWNALKNSVAKSLTAGPGITIVNDITNNTTVISAPGAGGLIPLVDGSVPPNLMYEKDGTLVMAAQR